MGYVDTIGFDVDATNIIVSENKWRYRDYVIAAWNQDKPFDRFLEEQIAGDEIVDWRRAEHYTPEINDCLIATGFLRMARRNPRARKQHPAQSFRCPTRHGGDRRQQLAGPDAELRPLPQPQVRPHYAGRLLSPDGALHAGLQSPAVEAGLPLEDGNPRPYVARRLPLRGAAIEEHNSRLAAQENAIRQRCSAMQQPYRERLREAKLNQLPEAIRGDTKAAVDMPTDKRSEVQKYLAQKFEKAIEVSESEIVAALDEPDKRARNTRGPGAGRLEAQRQSFGKIQCLFDVGPPPETHLLVRGNFLTPGPVVEPGFPKSLSAPESPTGWIRPCRFPIRRAAGPLAHWLTASDTPPAGLVSRVFVNRLWQHLFGVGIVPTVENIGLSGLPPTHPELLEWLSADFVASGWRIEALLRTMLLSTAYRQASSPLLAGQATEGAAAPGVDPAQADPGNELLWRMRLRRLESETIRDCLLATSGQLDSTQGGPPVPIETLPDGRVVVAEAKLARPTDKFRRSVYLLFRRAYNVSLLTVFDQPLVTTTCPIRDTSAVALQSLTMMNDAFLAEQAEAFAKRVANVSQASGGDEIETAFRLATIRSPNQAEMAICRQLRERQIKLFLDQGASAVDAGHKSLVQLCLTLLNTNEFLYVQ